MRHSQVSRDTDALDHRRQGNERLGIGHWEAVFASSNGHGTSSSETSLEVDNVAFLIVSDILEVGVELGREASVGESLLVPFAECLLVERVLKMFELCCVS